MIVGRWIATVSYSIGIVGAARWVADLKVLKFLIGIATPYLITLTTFTQFAQNSTVGCTFALYGCTMHIASKLHLSLLFRSDKAMNITLLYEDIWTSFFCLVCCLKKKRI